MSSYVVVASVLVMPLAVTARVKGLYAVIVPVAPEPAPPAPTKALSVSDELEDD